MTRVLSAIAGALLAALVLGPTIGAQEKPASPPEPSLTAVEQKEKEILDLHRQLVTAYRTIAELQAGYGTCQGTLGGLQFQQNTQAFSQEQTALKERIELRTGYAWDPDTGKFGAKKPVEVPKKPAGGG